MPHREQAGERWAGLPSHFLHDWPIVQSIEALPDARK